jgi:hypothetical protein
LKIDSSSQYPYVTSVIPGSPAETAGIIAGDWIYKIEDNVVHSNTLEQVTNSIRGDAGTSVTITFSRGGIIFDRTIKRISLDAYSTQQDTSSGIHMSAGGDEFCTALEKIIIASPGNFQSLKDSIFDEDVSKAEYGEPGFGDDMLTQTYLNNGSIIINKYTSKVKLPGIPNAAIFNSENDTLGFYFICYFYSYDSAIVAKEWITMKNNIADCLVGGICESCSKTDYEKKNDAIDGTKIHTQEITFEKVSNGYNQEIRNSLIRVIYTPEYTYGIIKILVLHRMK